MSWTIAEQELARGVEQARGELEEYRDWDTLELLARAMRWADELTESRRLFHEAATDAVATITQHGQYAGDVCSRTAGYFALAGELEPAREWAARAVEDFLAPRDVHGDGKPADLLLRDAGFAVETLAVCELGEQALALAAQTGVRNLAVELIEAQRDGNVDAVVERLTRALAAERVPPYDAYAQYPVHVWDWLEFAFVARARLAGEPVPSHRQMLERAGLLGDGASGRVVRLEAGGVDRFSVLASDGTPIEATVARESAASVEITLDPRGPHYLAIGFYWPFDDGYRLDLYIAPNSSSQQALPYQGTDFREAVEATADWLDGQDLFGRDGSWAARTLTAITKDLPVRGEESTPL